MESVKNNPVLSKVFGLFQDYQRTGQFSRLVLETRGGFVTANLSVQCSPQWTPWMQSSRPTETKKPRRTTPSRRRRNKYRREKWLSEKKEKTSVDNSAEVLNQDNSIPDINKDSKVVDKSVVTDSITKDLKVLQEGQSTKVVQTVEGSEMNTQKFGVIEQVDGGIEPAAATVTFDLTISAVQLVDAYCSIEDNLCYGEVDKKLIFINEKPSSEVKETNSENTLFTFDIQFENEEKSLEQLYERFKSWDPLYFGKPRGKLVNSAKRL